MKGTRSTKSEVSDYLDRRYYDLQVGGTSSEHLRAQQENILELLGSYDNELILDAGCGSGKYSALLSNKARSVALDFSPTALLMARNTIRQSGKAERASLVRSRGEILPLRPKSFDRIVALDFVEHISAEEFRCFAREAYRVLKPDGLLCIYTPNRKYWYEAIYTAVAGRSPTQGHIDVKTSKRIQALLERSGFTVIWKALKPSHYAILRSIEGLMIGIPGLAQIAGRRICMRAVKKS